MLDSDWIVEKEIRKVDMMDNAAVEKKVVEMEWKMEFVVAVWMAVRLAAWLDVEMAETRVFLRVAMTDPLNTVLLEANLDNL